MEAQCGGIPVIATAVGGTPELVNEENGVLLPANPEVAEVAAALSGAIRDPVGWLEKRKKTRQTWQDMSDAASNYASFVRRLGAMFQPTPHSAERKGSCLAS